MQTEMSQELLDRFNQIVVEIIEATTNEDDKKIMSMEDQMVKLYVRVNWDGGSPNPLLLQVASEEIDMAKLKDMLVQGQKELRKSCSHGNPDCSGRLDYTKIEKEVLKVLAEYKALDPYEDKTAIICQMNFLVVKDGKSVNTECFKVGTRLGNESDLEEIEKLKAAAGLSSHEVKH
ncbi:MAG TPA: hypothetical protein VHZ76_00730 [Gammaproteobacteria bacterium]|jgi:hypothetical protein|nr:hypothetical protein [Gammaproteobacteria bacterium]